jgi:lysophospholipase L1-like esterase
MRSLALFLLTTLAACSRAHADPTPPAPSASPPASSSASGAAVPAPSAYLAPNKDAPQPPHAFSTKLYRTVLQTGDSMVGGGLCRALQPRFAAEGSKFVRDVWESGSIEAFAESDRVPKLVARHDPDLVLLNLGANDVGGNVTPYLGKKIEKVAALTQTGGPRDCIWIGPPRWKVDGSPVVEMIKQHVAPCVFFDSTDVEMHRKPDKVHPDEKGGDEWAVALWHFLRGPATDAGSFDVLRGVLR